MYLEEIQSVRQGRMRYYAPVRSFINTFFDLLLYVADTPERNKLLAFLDGGNYGFRSLYAGTINPKLFTCCDGYFRKYRALVELSRGEVNDDTDASRSQGQQCNRSCNCGTLNQRVEQYRNMTKTIIRLTQQYHMLGAPQAPKL